MSFKGGVLTNAGRPLSTASVATLGSHPITENGKGGCENNDRRKRHPYRRPPVSAHLPRVPHTERNPFFSVRFLAFTSHLPLTTRHCFFVCVHSKPPLDSSHIVCNLQRAIDILESERLKTRPPLPQRSFPRSFRHHYLNPREAANLRLPINSRYHSAAGGTVPAKVPAVDPVIESVGDFLNEANKIKTEWFPDEDLRPWYRGQKRAEWGLLPGLYRLRSTFKQILDDQIEDEIREDFIVRAPIFSEYKPAGDDDWEWYFLMQHYGAPTRLLDWTQGALLALYFAVKDNPGHFDAAVWALDPYALNKRVLKRYEVIPPSAQGVSNKDRASVKPWLPTRFRQTLKRSRPIAVFPAHVAPRISTQRSCFTIHGTDYLGLVRFVGLK